MLNRVESVLVKSKVRVADDILNVLSTKIVELDKCVAEHKKALTESKTNINEAVGRHSEDVNNMIARIETVIIGHTNRPPYQCPPPPHHP